MAKIDHFLRSLTRFGARGLLLTSNSHIVLRFPAGDRHATQSTPHAQLVELIYEITTPGARAQLDSGESTSFDHAFEGNNYTVAVRPDASLWGVSIEPAAPSASSAPAKAPEPSPEPRAKRRPTMSTGRWIDDLLTEMINLDASDLHISSGCPIYMRIHGDMKKQAGEPLSGDFLQEKLMEIAPEKNRGEFAERSDTDFAYTIEGLSRFRVNIFMDRKGPGAVLRAIPHEIPSAKKIGVPDKVLDLCNLTKGLVLVTGPTGSGKSTTLAALINHINENREAHLITVEDPIEFVHPNKKCLINQRELHTHTRSFEAALRAALREDPDIVLVGEMRDLETIAMAVETAETGHLVFGTLHTSTAPSTVDRIIDQFPADRQEQIRQMLAKSLKGVIAQTLCRRKGGGRVAAYEILFGTSAVENLIRERKTFQLFSVMQTGRNQGMRTLGDSLIELVRNGVVEPQEAYLKAVNKDEFKNLLARAGIQL